MKKNPILYKVDYIMLAIAIINIVVSLLTLIGILPAEFTTYCSYLSYVLIAYWIFRGLNVIANRKHLI